MTDAGLIDDLEARGLVQECTDRAGLAARLAEGPVTLYNGCDPTADSLHIGNLLGLLVLRRFQDAGHRPLALVGGATGMIGDPSGRSEERNLLDEETLGRNVAAIKGQVARILDIGGGTGAGAIVDNREWTGDVSFLDFLRDVGKHVTVGTMLGRESVKNRMASEHGISYTEFSYMLIQANDFLQLEQSHGCQLQVGGSDQLGNMLGGIDLIRRVRQRPAWALAWPLLTAADGTKLGKTTGARIWLDPSRTSPYQFFQHWMGTDDRLVDQFLKQFTLLPLPAIAEAVADHEADPGRRSAHRLLAREVTSLVHGPEEAAAAEAASAILFGAPLAEASEAAMQAVAAEVGTTPFAPEAFEAGIDLVDALVADGELAGGEVAGLATSKGDARRALEQGGVYVNGARMPADATIGVEHLLHGQYVLVRRGKKAYRVIERRPNAG